MAPRPEYELGPTESDGNERRARPRSGYRGEGDDLRGRLTDSIHRMEQASRDIETKMKQALDEAERRTSQQVRAAVAEGMQALSIMLQTVSSSVGSLETRVGRMEQEQGRQGDALSKIDRTINGDGATPGVPFRLNELERTRKTVSEKAWDLVKWLLGILVAALAYFLGKYADKVDQIPPGP